LALLLAATQSPAAADTGGTSVDAAQADFHPELFVDEQRRWNVHIDNDLLVFSDKDRDYTAGAAFTLVGDSARHHPVSLSEALGWIDGKTRFDAFFSDADEETHALEIGLLIFTPHEIADPEPLFDDRPYANLTYVGSTRLIYDPASPTAYQSSLIVGFLGLPMVEQLHRSVHDIVGAEKPTGYDHQISDGGEPTFRYSLSRYDLLASSSRAGRSYALRLGWGASVGYITEANVELGARWGTGNTPWWSAFAESADYAGHPTMTPRIGSDHVDRVEWEFSAGVKLRARLYNSFLQGQFRDSDVTYSSSELNHLLLEGWIGVTALLPNNFSVSYTIRHQTEELETGRGARGFTWASLSVSQRF
jgi:hypothetical protein